MLFLYSCYSLFCSLIGHARDMSVNPRLLLSARWQKDIQNFEETQALVRNMIEAQSFSIECECPTSALLGGVGQIRSIEFLRVGWMPWPSSHRTRKIATTPMFDACAMP